MARPRRRIPGEPSCTDDVASRFAQTSAVVVRARVPLSLCNAAGVNGAKVGASARGGRVKLAAVARESSVGR